MNKALGIGGIALVVVGGLFLVVSNQPGKDAMRGDDSMQKEDVAMQKNDGAVMEKKDAGVMEKPDEAMMKKESESMTEGDAAMAKSGSYETYSPEKVAMASSGDVLLFFHASWCPICRGIESEIKADTSKIPAGVHVLKVDYDTAVPLRQKYGVTVQHTFVQVDASGNSLQKFSDASTLSDVLSRVK